MQSYIVSGGYPGPAMVSTEILKKEGGSSWQKVSSLPSERWGLRGVSLPNGHFMVSGEDCSILSMFYDTCYTGGALNPNMHVSLRSPNKKYKDVLDYDPDTDKWTKVGEMAHTRYFHGMSLVPKETADYCD